jgi:hypothetical protein
LLNAKTKKGVNYAWYISHSPSLIPFTVTNCDENPQASPITWLVGGAGKE